MSQERKSKIIKEEGKKARPANKKQWDKLLQDLPPGEYDIIFRPVDTRLQKIKRAYFAMESELALHLGYTKRELHQQLKELIGQHTSPETGEKEYLSVAKVDNDQDMLQRIEELHRLAAEHLNYTFQPYTPEE